MLWLRSRKAGYTTLISPRALKTTFTTELGSTLNHALANKVVWEGSSNPSYWSGVMVLQIMWDSYGWNENQEGRWLRLLGVRVFSCCGAPRGWFALQGPLINFCSNRPWIKKEIVMRACLLGYKVICSSVLDEAFAGFVVYMLMGENSSWRPISWQEERGEVGGLQMEVRREPGLLLPKWMHSHWDVFFIFFFF